MKIKKLRASFHTCFVVQNPFKLNFAWREGHESARNVEANEAKSPMRMPVPTTQSIDCSVFSSQSLQLVKIPLQVDLLGDLGSGEEGAQKSALKLE